MPFPVDPKFIQRAAERLGVRLPASYVARLTRENGGELIAGDADWQLYPVFDDSDRTRIKRTCNHVVRETMLARTRPDLPTTAIAIGEDGGGNHLVLLSDPDVNRLGNAVYRWDHETGEVERLADDLADL